MQQQHVTRTSRMEGADQRRAPPPPPPRGVTLRSTSAVAAAAASMVTASKVTHTQPPLPSASLSSASSAPAINRMQHNPLKPSGMPSSVDHLHHRSLMKENYPMDLTSLSSSSASGHQQQSPVHLTKQQQAQQGYLETRYAYSVNGILGSAAQASAAAAFFAR